MPYIVISLYGAHPIFVPFTVNGNLIRNTTLQRDVVDDGGNYFMLIDTGNPSFTMPEDMMSQITVSVNTLYSQMSI